MSVVAVLLAVTCLFLAGRASGPGAGGLLVAAVALFLAAWFVCEVALAGRAWAARRPTPTLEGTPAPAAARPAMCAAMSGQMALMLLMMT